MGKGGKGGEGRRERDPPPLLADHFNHCEHPSINQSLFQAEAHRTNNKENANIGNRTEQTHRRIQVKKLRLKTIRKKFLVISLVHRVSNIDPL